VALTAGLGVLEIQQVPLIVPLETGVPEALEVPLTLTVPEAAVREVKEEKVLTEQRVIQAPQEHLLIIVVNQ
jgi:hypothetical protein